MSFTNYSLTRRTGGQQQNLSATCGCAGHNGESCQRLVADVVAVDEEAGQILHGIKLAFQHLLGPLTHQVTGGKPNLLLDAAELTW